MNPLEVAQQILEEELEEDAKALFKKNRDEKGVKGSAEEYHEDEEEKDEPEEEIEDGLTLDLPEQLGTHMEEIPRAPNPAGLKHLVRIGCCNSCLGRLGGKKRYDQTIEESGIEIRDSVVNSNKH